MVGTDAGAAQRVARRTFDQQPDTEPGREQRVPLPRGEVLRLAARSDVAAGALDASPDQSADRWRTERIVTQLDNHDHP